MANLTIKDIAKICGVELALSLEQLMMIRVLIRIPEKEF